LTRLSKSFVAISVLLSIGSCNFFSLLQAKFWIIHILGIRILGVTNRQPEDELDWQALAVSRTLVDRERFLSLFSYNSSYEQEASQST
jgi:hypothetical protein